MFILEPGRKNIVKVTENGISILLNRWIKHVLRIIFMQAFCKNFILLLCNIILKFSAIPHEFRNFPGNFREISGNFFKKIQKFLSSYPIPPTPPHHPHIHPYSPHITPTPTTLLKLQVHFSQDTVFDHFHGLFPTTLCTVYIPYLIRAFEYCMKVVGKRP